MISLSLASDEILDALQGECPKAIEILSFSILADDEALSFVSKTAIKTVKNRSDSNVEQWVRLKPDHIFAASFNKKETLNKLAAFKLSHSVLKPVLSLHDVRTNITLMGKTLDCEIGAKKLMDDMNAVIVDFKPMKKRSTGILFVGKNVVVGSKTLPNEIFQMTGMTNLAAAAGLFDWPTVSSEWILKMRPFHIVVFDSQAYEEVKKSPFFNPKLSRVTQVSGKALFSASHHVVQALELLKSQIN